MKYLIQLTFLFFIGGSALVAQTSFKNPILTGMNPDPSICRVGDDFYLVTSTFEYFPGLPIYQSKDLVHWKMIGYALARPSNNPLMGCESGTGGQYAPTLRYSDSTFYITCTNYGGQGSQGAFYVTAKNPAGPWSDPIWVKNWYVDPSPMFENDSMYYLSPDNNGSFLLGTMNPATGTYFKPLKKIAEGLGGTAPEGPHMYKINDYYYLMSAEGGTGYDHREVIQKSSSPYGPFEPSPNNPVVSHRTVPTNPFQAIGHADLVQLPDSSWWLVCLGFRPVGGNFHHLGRETFLAPVTWNAAGWPKVGTDGIIKQEYPVPNLPEYIWETKPNRDDFDSLKLDLDWNFIRNPHAADWSLTANPGFLRLKGSKYSFKEKDSPAFVGRRQTAFKMVASAKLSFTPTKSTEEAGLVVRGDDKNHYDLLLTKIGDKTMVIFRKYLQERISSIIYKEVPSGDVILRVSATELEYQFWVQQEGKTAELIGIASSKDLSTEKIGGFTGTYIGMYASGNGAANVNPADFDWFEFESDPTLPYSWSVGPKDTVNQMLAPQIASVTSETYDMAKIVWKNTENATAYIIEKFQNNKFDSIATTLTNDTVFTDQGLTGITMYSYRIIAKNEQGYSNPSLSASIVTLPKPGPYFEIPSLIPGKIEAENYDYGKNNVAFYDTDASNNGGKYRTDPVDIESCSDTNNGYSIGWLNYNEWLIYTVDVVDSLYDIEVRVAAPSASTLKIHLDGKQLVSTTVAATGGYQTWKTVLVKNVKMVPGLNKKLKLTFGGGYNFNWIKFIKVLPNSISQVHLSETLVFPNPTTGIFQINSRQRELTKIEFFNITGSIVKTISTINDGMVDISDLNNGMYIAKLYSNSRETSYIKLIKN